MHKIAVIGDETSIFCFKAIGFDTYCENSPIKASSLLHELVKQQYAVIFIIEDLYKKMDTAVSRYTSEGLPAIISIPGIAGSDGSGMSAVKRAAERAVGADIIK